MSRFSIACPTPTAWSIGWGNINRARGSLVSTMLAWGLSYNTPQDAITQGMAIAAAVTATDTSAAIRLVGVPLDAIALV